MTYEQRLKELQKAHAVAYNRGLRQEFAGGPFLTKGYEEMRDEAEVTICAQADAVRTVWMFCYNGNGTATELESHSNDCEDYLRENGYICNQ